MLSNNWRDVPMPPQIAKLPRDKRGFPIPYVAEWSGDTTGLIKSGDRMINACDCKIGVGEPSLGNVCPQRQRQCMVRRRCQVCSRKIHPRSMLAFIGAKSANGFTEPPLHIDCARYSAAVCSGIRAKHEGYGITFAVDYSLYGEYIIGLDGAGELVKTWVPISALPPRTWAGKPAVLGFYLARPFAIRSLPIDAWLEEPVSA